MPQLRQKVQQSGRGGPQPLSCEPHRRSHSDVLLQHVQSEGIRAELNNNLSERLQGTFRQRTKTLRGLDNAKSGQVYLDGWAFTYNQFREHEALGDKTPASVAKVSTSVQVVGESGCAFVTESGSCAKLGSRSARRWSFA